MNKLVSKNSILRFKLGKKIIKAEEGAVARWQRRIKSGINGIGNAFKGAFNMTFDPNNTLFGSLKIYNFYRTIPSKIINGLVVENYTPENGGSINNRARELRNLLQQTTDYSRMKGGTRLRSAEEQKKWEAEVQRLKNLMKNDLRKVVNKQRITPRFLSKYANMVNTIGGANNIRAWLQKLKKYYAPGTYNPDSVWGDNTQAAYERYLAEQNNNLGLVKLNPVSISPVKESVLQNALAEPQKLHFVKQGGQLYSRNPIKRFKSNFRVSGPVTTLKTGGLIPIYKKGSKAYATNNEYLKIANKLGLYSKDSVKAYLRKLGVKDDGIWGNDTLKAYNNKLFSEIASSVLPLLAGMITFSSSSQTYKPWRPTEKVGVTGACGTENCSEWANKSLKRHKDSKGRVLYANDEVGGDAWTRLSAGKHAKMIYSGYEGLDYDPNNYDYNLAHLRNWQAALNLYNNFDSKTLDKNKVYLVNMYYNGSPQTENAWRNGTEGTTGTHTGNLYWNPDTNSWRVAHNIHNKLYDDDFIKIQGVRKGKHQYGVTAIAEAPMIDYTRQDWNKAHPIKAAINRVYDFGMWKEGGKLKKKLISKAQGGLKTKGLPITSKHLVKSNGDWDYDVANPEGYDLSPIGITRTYQGLSTYGNSDSLPVAHSLVYINNRLTDLANRYGLSVNEARELLGDTLAVLWNESGGASRKKVDPKTGKVVENTLYNSKDNNPLYMFGVRSVNKLLGRGTSEGYGRVKILDLRDLPNYSIKTEEELLKYPKRTPHFSGLSTYASIALRYTKLKEMFKDHPELIYDDSGKLSELGHALLLTSHNQGFDNILKNYNKYLLNGDILELELYKTFRYPRLSLQLIKGHNISGSTPYQLPEIVVTPSNRDK